jgi:hypothetical protein
LADGLDQSRLFRTPQELRGQDETSFGVLPADESLDSEHASTDEIDLGLEVAHEVAMFDGVAQLGFHV